MKHISIQRWPHGEFYLDDDYRMRRQIRIYLPFINKFLVIVLWPMRYKTVLPKRDIYSEDWPHDDGKKL